MTPRPGPAIRTLARIAYSLLWTVASPVNMVRLWWRGRAEPLYRHAIGERWGHYSAGAGVDAGVSEGRLWIHAVSLGETRAARPLIDALRASRPGLRLLLTHGTATGRAAGAALLREGDLQCWLPVDSAGAVRRFLDRFKPAAGVLMETEVWPNLLHAAAERSIPIVLANARLSERSLRSGQRFGMLLGPAFRSLARVLAQSEADARRLREAGATDVRVAGNLKFDLAPDPAHVERGRAWREAIDRDVVLAAVTREGEEPSLLAAWKRLAAPRPLLVIVPRHPQRFDEVAEAVRAAGFTLARRSSWSIVPPPEAAEADVWLGDSMNEMAVYYGMAHVGLLGGSFAPLGGQNLIEAAACGCPIVMGPHTFNFAEAAEGSLAAGASVRVASIEGGVEEAAAMLVDKRRLQRSSRSLAFAGSQRGAAARMAEQISGLLPG